MVDFILSTFLSVATGRNIFRLPLFYSPAKSETDPRNERDRPEIIGTGNDAV